MSIKTEGVHAGEFLLSEANGSRSRENIVIAGGAGRLAAGTVLAVITAANAVVVTATPVNAGDGTVGNTAALSDAVSGSYSLTITDAEAGMFELSSPSGQLIATGEVGEAFIGAGITLTVTAGSTPFADGDSFTLVVNANLGEYVAYDEDGANDGRRTASAILYGPVDATDTDVLAVGIVRDAEVVARLLTGLDDNGVDDLEAQGLVIRP